MKRKILWIESPSKRIRVLYYWGKCLGINPLSLSKKNKLKFSYISFVYGCFLTMLYCHVYYQVVMVRFSTLLPEESPIAIIVDFLGISGQFLEGLSALFVFAIHQNRVKIIIKSFVTAGKTSEKLGIRDDWDKSFKEFGAHLLFHNMLYLASLSVSHWTWGLVYGMNSILWIKFDLPGIPSFNAKIIVIWCLILVRRKFRQLNKTIESLMANRCAKRNGPDQRLKRHSSCGSGRVLDRINMVSQLHRELRDIIHCIEKHFALFILFSIASGFTYCTLNVYRIYIYMRGHPRRAIELTYLGALHHWIIYPAVLLGVISYVCGSTLNEANNTGCVLHELITKNKCFHDTPQAVIKSVNQFVCLMSYFTCRRTLSALTIPILDAVKIRFTETNCLKWNTLSLDLLKNRVHMSVYGLFELDHFLVYRTVATAATYLTIMLQLYN